MSSEPAVSIREVSKKYPLRHDVHDHEHLALAALEKLKHPLKRRPVDWLWALEDVSFDVADGEVLGLIGHNGAGKSTLLKVLTRITSPTRGEIRIRGRLGSLLEVGTGFHPELTGRENIYLNGSILGMGRREVAAVFDSIVEFAEVDRFLDTRVKRLSSGMFVRLAFSVASHRDRDVLLLDEVLAVGDRNFRAKCFERITAARDDGRTVILVSHQLDFILENCSRTVVMAHGRVAFDGFTPDAAKVIEFAAEPFRLGAPEFHVALDICDEDGTVLAHADSRVWAFDVLPGAPYPCWPGRMATGGARTITEFVVDDASAPADPPGSPVVGGRRGVDDVTRSRP